MAPEVALTLAALAGLIGLAETLHRRNDLRRRLRPIPVPVSGRGGQRQGGRR